MLTSIILEIPSGLILALKSLFNRSGPLSFDRAAGRYPTRHILQLFACVNTSTPSSLAVLEIGKENIPNYASIYFLAMFDSLLIKEL